jgi:hypothetical protein
VIYFIRSEGTGSIKIGMTAGDAEERMPSLQTGNPSQLLVFGYMEGDRQKEAELHRRFASAREGGEWFRPTIALLEYIRDNATSWPEEFAEQVKLEPRLADLWHEAKTYRATDGFCANAVWHGYDGNPGIKARLEELVGEEAKKAKLRTSKAYDLAYDVIYDALPDCQHEGSLCP